MSAVSTTNPAPAGTGRAPRLRRDVLLAVASIAPFMVVLDYTPGPPSCLSGRRQPIRKNEAGSRYGLAAFNIL